MRKIYEDADEFFPAKLARRNTVRYVSHRAYQNNNKSNAAKYFGEDQEMNWSSKSASMASQSTGKKSTIIWTKGLRNKFLEAIGKLGIDNAAPKKILEHMNVEGLTRDHVSSYLQKYRLLLKKIANEKNVQIASKPSLLESSMVNDPSSLMPNQEQMNLPAYSEMYSPNPPINTSSSGFPFLEDSNFNAATSSAFIHPGSFQNEGCSMQAMPKNLDEQRNLIYDASIMGCVNQNSSNSRFVPDLNNFVYDYGGFSTELHPYNNIEMGSSSGVIANKELAMSWDQENPMNNGNVSFSSVEDTSIGIESNYSGQSEFVEMGSLYGSNSNGNLENGIEEDDLVLSEADIDSLLVFADDNGAYGPTSTDITLTLESPNQDVNVENIQDIVTFDLNKTEETTSINHHQTVDGYLPSGSDPTINMRIDEQLMEPIWSPEPIADDMTLQGLILNPNVQD
ncbi:hypothetical protein SSX86_003632 [Deinandra increscens subsp. villosa]|uniref:HTH myb-type domain-containing protein n=1 Tax=Deinandra increscens subsp. villosa TaxID=3103831 RepID=A0AAP0DQD4_9ASTR